ncbi:MAG: T9SS type A sorting domain-containing protein, partial [Reichenbachiella sp.]
VNPAYQESLEISICQGEEYELGNQSLSTTGEYTELFSSDLGCDSLVSVNLSVNEPYEEVINLDICFGEKYLFGNTFITQSGSFSELFISKNECDSLVTLNINITQPIDNTIEVRFDTIRSNESNAEYNWYNCNTQEIELNAHEQQFSPKESGSYYVEISKGGCTSTTSCLQVFISTLTTLNHASEIKLYPIPHETFFTIDFGTYPFTGDIQIFDITGSIVSNNLISNKNEIQLQINGQPGIYFIHIYNALSKEHEVIKTYKK